MGPAEVPRELKWRCRRGMRELDALLTGWLEQRWPVADRDLREAFRLLLECEDDQLWDWLLGRTRPDSDPLCRIVDAIRDGFGRRV
ncbi:MAG: succinate dehydrogenase assembly factor 2 [Wenzhouxiangella sp.]